MLKVALTALLTAIAVFSLTRWAPAQEPAATERKPADLVAHELASLRRKLAKSGKPYLSFLDEPSMSMGLYRLPAGAHDGQSPHDLDEVYYVIEGKAKLRVGSEVVPAQAGDVLFVRQHAEHRFEEISEDLLLLVVFSKAK